MAHTASNRVPTRTYHLQPPTMPPKRDQSSIKSIEQEGRILLAIKDIQNGSTDSIRMIAERYQIPRSTLQDRLNGQKFRVEIRANSHKLTQLEEDSLVQWIFSMDSRGAAPRPSTVRDMANILLASRGTTPSPTVSKNWPSNFVKRRKELCICFSRHYNYQRAQNEDPKTLQE